MVMPRCEHNRRRTDDLEMIQGILFGSQMEQIESRLSDLDARIDERLRSLSTEMHHQLNGIRKELKDKTDVLNDSDATLRVRPVGSGEPARRHSCPSSSKESGRTSRAAPTDFSTS